MVSSPNVDAVAANNVALRTRSDVRTRDDEQWKTNFDPDHTCREEHAQTSLEHFCTETSRRDNHLQSRL